MGERELHEDEQNNIRIGSDQEDQSNSKFKA